MYLSLLFRNVEFKLGNTLTHPLFIGHPTHFLAKNFNRFSRYILCSRVFYFPANIAEQRDKGIWARRLEVNFEAVAETGCQKS
jgi:hypothetical protein